MKNAFSLPDTYAFQQTIDDKPTNLYILKKGNLQAAITNFGGRLVSLLVPDRKNILTDVLVGFDSVSDYQKSTEPYYGATIGRYGNRIANGKFTLDGHAYTLAINNGPNSLHGGIKGFQYVVWDAEQVNEYTLQLSYVSKDGEEGYPGNLHVKIIFSLTDRNELHIAYEATTDKPTVINLTNHAYYNLNGQGSGTILNHLLQINADAYTPVNDTLIPFGTIMPVANTPFDFTKQTVIGSRINKDNEQLKNGKGYDHNFVINGAADAVKFTARAVGNETGITMEVFTREPGVQFYTGNFMKGENQIKGGYMDDYRTAFCLETQHYPDSPNQPNFPSTVLNPGEVYHTETLYRFSATNMD